MHFCARLYFVVESKGSDLGIYIKENELSKIKCVKKHFLEISQHIQLIQAKNFNKIKEHI